MYPTMGETMTHTCESMTVADVVELLGGLGLLVGTPPAALGTDGGAVVTGCSFDSRDVRPGHLFFAKGAHFEDRYLELAVEAGAVCCVAEKELAGHLAQLGSVANLPVIAVGDVRMAMAALPPVVLGHPDRDLTVVGITGTKGKSTTAYMLKSILDGADRTPGILGSIMTDDGAERYESHNTTPEAPELWRHLDNCRRAGRDAMVMEVSSQGLKYDRVRGLNFDVACFLNIGRDHISAVEHPTFEDYFESKLKIFSQCDAAVVNLGTDEADRVLAATGAAKRLITLGVDREDATVCATDVVSADGRITFTLTLAADLAENGEPQRMPVALGISGLFNVENALAAIACARLMGVSLDDILAGLATLRVPGRMEVVRSEDDKVVCIVDYAHNKLSFEALFASVEQEYAGRRVVAVFGAAGGKAKERRRDLPQAAGPHCDLMIFTEEDPAHEPVEEICAQMAQNVPEGCAYEIVCDREQAVAHAFKLAREMAPSVLLLLAKGDETRQHRGDDYPEVESDLSMARRLING